MRWRLTVFMLLLATTARADPPKPTVRECLAASEAGQEERDRGKLNEARALFARCVQSSCPDVVQASCTKWLSAVVEALPSIVIVARGDEDIDLNATVSVDGAAPSRVVGESVSLNPGEHTLVVRAEGFQPTTHRVLVSIGEQNRLIRVPMQKAPREAPADVPRAKPRAEPSAITLGLGGLALVAGGASVILGLGARSDLEDVRSAPCATTRTCSSDELDGIRTRFIIADVALGVAVIAGAAALWRFFSQPSPKIATGPISSLP